MTNSEIKAYDEFKAIKVEMDIAEDYISKQFELLSTYSEFVGTSEAWTNKEVTETHDFIIHQVSVIDDCQSRIESLGD